MACAPLIALARTRLPNAELRVGEMEDLPWEDHSFDLVTGFNSKAAIVDGLAPYRRSDGSYRLENEYRYLIARA